MSDALIEKKFQLLKSIWIYFITEKVSISLPLLPGNVRIILKETIGLIDELNTVKTDKQKKSLIKRIFNQVCYLGLYLERNIYFAKEYSGNFNLILHEVEQSEKLGKNFDPLSLREKIICLLELIQSKNHLIPIINEIEKVMLNTADINDATILEIASLVVDLQSELLFVGYPEDVIRKFLDEFEFSYEKQDVDRRSLCDRFTLYKESLSVNDKEYEYVFRIRGLKVRTMPFTIDDILFYNPLRHDLMRKMQMAIYPEEKFLLDFESKEQEIFDTQDFTTYDEVAYTDCHARVKTKSNNYRYGEHLARLQLQEAIDKIRHIYKLRNIGISSNCVCIELENNFVKSYPLFIRTGSNKYDIAYWIEGLNNIISEDLDDEESLLNRSLKIDSEPWLTKIAKARRWYIRGLDSDDIQAEYVCYWISIEYLLKSNANQSMFQLMNKYALPLLIRLAYENELAALFHYFRNKLSQDVPLEIKDIPDIGDFPIRVNRKVFAKNILLFTKYTEDDLVKYRIRFLSEFCSNPKVQRESISDLQNRYRFLLSELTRIRNKMVHASLNVEFNLNFYCSYLRFISTVLISNYIYLYDAGFGPAKLREGCTELLKLIKQGNLVDIF